jgi:hypothetical protein
MKQFVAKFKKALGDGKITGARSQITLIIS